jgi:hypothetical protein
MKPKLVIATASGWLELTTILAFCRDARDERD